MSNKTAFNLCVARANDIQYHAISLITPPTMVVAATVIQYADRRIKELEAQIEAMLETAEGAGIPRCQFDDDLKNLKQN